MVLYNSMNTGGVVGTLKPYLLSFNLFELFALTGGIRGYMNNSFQKGPIQWEMKVSVRIARQPRQKVHTYDKYNVMELIPTLSGKL